MMLFITGLNLFSTYFSNVVFMPNLFKFLLPLDAAASEGASDSMLLKVVIFLSRIEF